MALPTMLELLEYRLTQMAFNLATTPWQALSLGKFMRHLCIPSQQYRAHRISHFGLMVFKRLISHQVHFTTYSHTDMGVNLQEPFIQYSHTTPTLFRFHQIHWPLLRLYYSNPLFSVLIKSLQWHRIGIHPSLTVEAWQVEANLSMPAFLPN